MKTILYYVHDPMCSWCWGFTSALNELLENLPKEIEVHRLLGGLASDSDLPMPDFMQQQIKNNWSQIQDTISGVKFNFDFWSNNIPRRSTYLACRAIIAAREQGEKYDIAMTKAIQNAYYQQALNPSDLLTLIQIAANLGLDKDIFTQSIKSEEVNKTLMQEIMFSRNLFVESYPSLLLKVGERVQSIDINYNFYHPMYEEIINFINAVRNNVDIEKRQS